MRKQAELPALPFHGLRHSHATELLRSGIPAYIVAKRRKSLGLPDQRFHDLRHFHATQLLRAGTPLHVVAQRLGHRDAMVTATTYAHVTSDQEENASITFAKAIN
jgi:integrase